MQILLTSRLVAVTGSARLRHSLGVHTHVPSTCTLPIPTQAGNTAGGDILKRARNIFKRTLTLSSEMLRVCLSVGARVFTVQSEAPWLRGERNGH